MEKKNIKLLAVSIICIVVALVLYQNDRFLIKLITSNPYYARCLSQLLFAIYGVIALIILKKVNVLRFKTEGFGTGIVVAAFILVFDGFMLLMSIAQKTPITATPLEITCFVLQMVLIGVSEEILFRGIFQNAVMDFIGYDSVNKIRLGIVITGFAFGMTHLINGFSPEIGFSHAAIQALNVSFTGMIFAAAYFRSNKNLWVVILIHALGDAMAFIYGGGLSGVAPSETIGSNSVSVGLFAPILPALAVIWIIRKKKLEEYVRVE